MEWPDGRACCQRAVGVVCAFEGALAGARDHRVDLSIERIDPREVRLDDFSYGDFPLTNHARQLGCGGVWIERGHRST